MVWIRAGADARYYQPARIPEETRTDNLALEKACQWRRYVVVAGDMLRQEEMLPDVLRGLGLGLVRLTQNTYVEHLWHEWLSQGTIDFDVFCKANLSAAEVRYAYQRALCVLNLIDNSWQPAGWTVFVEAMACGIPVIMNRGLSTEEMRADLQDGEPLPFIELADLQLETARRALKCLSNDEGLWAELAQRGRAHIERHFTVEMSAEMVATVLETMIQENSQRARTSG